MAAHASVLIKHEFCSTHEDRGKIGLQHRDSIAKDQIDSWFYFLEKDGYIARTKGKILILPAFDNLKWLQGKLAPYLPYLVQTDESDRFVPLRTASVDDRSVLGLPHVDSQSNIASPSGTKFFHYRPGSSSSDRLSDSSSQRSSGSGSGSDPESEPTVLTPAIIARAHKMMDPDSFRCVKGLRHRIEKVDGDSHD